MHTYNRIHCTYSSTSFGKSVPIIQLYNDGINYSNISDICPTTPDVKPKKPFWSHEVDSVKGGKEMYQYQKSSYEKYCTRTASVEKFVYLSICSYHDNEKYHK